MTKPANVIRLQDNDKWKHFFNTLFFAIQVLHIDTVYFIAVVISDIVNTLKNVNVKFGNIWKFALWYNSVH